MINSCMIRIKIPEKRIEGLFGISLEENFFELDVWRVCYYTI